MRRTKEEAARTREAIVEAALACFDRSGIARATIDEIAAAAGVTKGAVYHHFGGKDEILLSIRDGVTLPLLDRADTAFLRGDSAPALERIERYLLSIIETLEADARTRRALRVMQYKCEYVAGLEKQLRSALKSQRHLREAFEHAYEDARSRGELAAGLVPAVAALETIAFLSGLVRLWLADPSRTGIRKSARAAIRAHVALRRGGSLSALRGRRATRAGR